MPTLLIYGSYGFTGDVITRLAVARGLRPILAGRNAGRLAAQAAELGLEHRVFSLDDSHAIDTALAGAGLLLNCAGPYVYTARQMVEACLRAGVHYLDLCGEVPVLQDILARDAEARARGVMLMPAAGFDVVATDCLAVYLKQRLPSATHLTLAFSPEGPGGYSRGTALSGLTLLPQGGRVRRDGRLESVAEISKTRLIDFGAGPVKASRFTWGDLVTAYHSTGIPNIEDFVVVPPQARLIAPLAGVLRRLLQYSLVQRLARLVIMAQPPGPSPARRARTRTHVWGEVGDAQGRTVAARLHGPQAGHDWTSQAALSVVGRVLAGEAPPGFQTPALAYGPDLVLEEGVTREDV
jgi:short subunit dehydrogenase-like uncharacterized protein